MLDKVHGVKYRLTYAVKLALRGLPIPNEVANMIKQNPKESATFAYNVKAHRAPVDESFLKAFSQDAHESRWYSDLAMDIDGNVPEFLIDSISKEPFHSARFAMHLMRKKFSTQLHSVDTDNMLHVSRNHPLPVPEKIMQSIARDSFQSYTVLRDMVERRTNKNKKIILPQILLDGLDSKPGLARAFYNDMRAIMPVDKIPPELKIKAGIVSKKKKS